MQKATDIAGMKNLLEEMLGGDHQDVVSLFLSVVTQLKQDNDRLNARLARLLKDRFGRKSEKIPESQLRLFLDEMAGKAPEVPEPEPENIPTPAPQRQRTPHGRKPLPAELPRETIVLEPSATEKICALCGRDKICIGHETSEVLEFEPGHFKVVAYERAKYACKPCGGEVVIAPTGDRPIEGGLPGYGLLSDILVRKYNDHIPLHRMRAIYQRSGFDLPVSSLADWVARGADLLDPLAHAIWARALLCHVLQVDDTGILVLDDVKKKGQGKPPKRGHIWCYLGDAKWAAYVYTPTWSGSGPCEFLKFRRGWVQADGYAGYNALFEQPGAQAIEVGCWAHARRRFVQAADRDKRALMGVKFIRDLYEIEHDATRDQLDFTGRQRLREARAPAILEKFHGWMIETQPGVLPKSELGGALTYTLNQWRALTRFLEDGALELDNNACERALRPIAVGRGNWKFAGSDDGAVRAATLFTILGTCRVNKVEPVAYLHDVMRKLNAGWKQSQIEDLLPPRWKELQA